MSLYGMSLHVDGVWIDPNNVIRQGHFSGEPQNVSQAYKPRLPPKTEFSKQDLWNLKVMELKQTGRPFDIKVDFGEWNHRFVHRKTRRAYCLVSPRTGPPKSRQSRRDRLRAR